MPGRDEALARFVAGLVWKDQSDAELDATLTAALTPEVYWIGERDRLPVPAGTLPAEPLLFWMPEQVPDALQPRLAAAWRRVSGALGSADAIRVSVSGPQALGVLRELAAAAGVPAVATAMIPGGGEFSWRCPVVVTAAESLRARLAALPLSGQYFVVVDPSEPADVRFVGFEETDDHADRSAGVVIAVGDAPPAALFDAAAAAGPVIAAGVPGLDLSWWPAVIRLLAANLPLDCALARTVPEALVAGPAAALTATTLQPSYRPDGGWTGPSVAVSFVKTGRGDGPEEVGAEPDDVGAEPPDTGPDPRRLVVEFRDGARKQRTVLPPGRLLTLEVAIAVPGRGQAAGSAAVPDPGAADAVVTLDVVATSSVWPEPQQAQMAWPVHDHGQPSTSAVFTLTTPAAGQVLTVGISVLYRGRPLQQADVVAAVRELAVPGERVRLVVRSTSTPPAPALIATPAGLSLDATGSELRNTFTGAAVPMAGLAGLLDAFEQRISRTLGVDDAPESLSDPAALSLLVDLARQGASLLDLLTGLGVGEGTGAVSLLVQPASRVLPLELLYTGVVPRRVGVKLCDHVRVPPPPGERCRQTSSRVVCPYAFWALNRTVARSVLLPTGRPRPLPAAIDLAPVLLAASDRADFGAPEGQRPSDQLAAACTQLFGMVDRVTSWSAWRRQVAALRPELLVLLAHTEVAGGEASLQIGRRSFLARPDITAAMVGGTPLVLLVACASAVAGDEFGTLPGTFTARGAAAVVGMLSKLSGRQGARAAAAVLSALRAAGHDGPVGLGTALAAARRDLVGQGLLVGMMVVAHGEIDVKVGG